MAHTLPQTPRKSAAAQSAALAALSFSSGTPIGSSSSNPPGIEPPIQEVMLNVLAAELDGAYWISDTILDTLFPVDQRVYDGVRNSPELKRVYSLQPEHLQATRRPSIMHSTAPTAPNSLPATLQAWPATKDGERAHYPPLRTLINTILELTAAQIRRSRLPESQVLGKLVCSVYDRQVQASSHTKISGLSKNLLKPDLILCTRAVAPTDTCCWGDLDVVMEVKEHWPILFNQAATYARCMLAEPRAKSGHRRRFCIALLFNHDDMHLTLAVYHRSGCTRTIEMPIYTEAGLDRLVRIIVGIRSIPDLEDLGYDVSSDTNPLLKDFVYSKTLFYRSSVLGRATRVDERSDIPYEGTQSFLHSLYERDAEELTDALKRTTIRDREPERQPETAARRSTRIQKGKTVPNNPVPDRGPAPREPQYIAIKRSWATDRHLVEEAACLKAVTGMFGLPVVLEATRKIPLLKSRRYDSTQHLIPSDAIRDLKRYSKEAQKLVQLTIYPNAEDDEDNENEDEEEEDGEDGQASNPDTEIDPTIPPEVRFHTQAIFATIGLPIENVKSPKVLFIVIAHATVGHWNIFSEGYLQRDVSIGNVMILKRPEPRKVVTNLDSKVAMETQKPCQGMLIDADHVIRWWNRGPVRSERRSGTIPYMSLRLLKKWIFSESAVFPHSALDDLESFIWIIVHILAVRVPTVETARWLENLGIQDKESHRVTRKGMAGDIIDWYEDIATCPRPLQPFAPFLGKLLLLSNVGAKAATHMENMGTRGQLTKEHVYERCRDFYLKYLAIFFEASEALPDTW